MNELAQRPSRDQVMEELRPFPAERGGVHPLQSLGCFGSIARGKATTESDVKTLSSKYSVRRLGTGCRNLSR